MPSWSVRLPLLLLVATGGLVAQSSVAPDEAQANRRWHPARCTEANIVDVSFDRPTAVDGVRVIVSRHSPAGGAALVRVDDGQSDRVVRVRGGISKMLEFSSPMTTTSLAVVLDPVLDAPHGACVERIELLHGGRTVATVAP